MEKRTNKTYSAKKGSVPRRWFLIDLEGKVLGRAATRIADILRGKNKPQFTPNVDTGDFVVAVNASKIKVTGKKMEEKEYHWHTGYIGGLKTVGLAELLEKKPEQVIKNAVRGMLPKNILGRNLLTKLKIYSGNAHPHAAQKPQELRI